MENRRKSPGNKVSIYLGDAAARLSAQMMTRELDLILHTYRSSPERRDGSLSNASVEVTHLKVIREFTSHTGTHVIIDSFDFIMLSCGQIHTRIMRL